MTTHRIDAAKRIVPVDAARGSVMLFSCLAHFAWWIHGTYPAAGDTLAAIGMVATPTFLMTSGAMVGMLCAKAARHGGDLKSQLFNRGLFLLTVGHLLIALAEAHVGGGLIGKLRNITVVDEIGLCTLVAALLIPQIGNEQTCRRLSQIAVVVLGVAWLMNLFWAPPLGLPTDLDESLVGGNALAPAIFRHTPVIQHLAIYVIGFTVGHYFARSSQQQVPMRDIAARFVASGGALVFAALALRLVRALLDGLDVTDTTALDISTTITAKVPPSPAYLLFFGGCGLLLVGLMFRAGASPRPAAKAAVEWLAVIGRASLVVFILQYFLYWTLPDLIDVHPNRWCLVYFVVNVLLIRLVAGMWGKLGGNRYLTFGIKLGVQRALVP